MLKEFYFIRHGQTDANLNRFMAGGKMDIPINQTGLEQARQASLKLSEIVPRMGAICTSPMTRAKQTARMFSAVYDCKIVTIEELREWDIGEWEGVPFHTIESAFFGSEDPPGGETRAAFRERVRLGLQSSAQHPGPHLLVGHGGVWRAIQEALEMVPMRLQNCVPLRVFINADEKWVFEEI